MGFFLAMFFTANLHAGWWQNFCVKHLLAEDPAQYALIPTSFVIKDVITLSIKENFNKLSPFDKQQLALARGTLRVRLEFPGPGDAEIIGEALKKGLSLDPVTSNEETN